MMMKTNLFIAEGENHVRDALHLLLEQEGFDIVGEADHVESLLAQVCTQPPALLLLDWNLPGLRPHHLLKTLREHCPKILIAVMSVRPEDRAISLAAGADLFIPKSLSPKKFLKALRTLPAKNNSIKYY